MTASRDDNTPEGDSAPKKKRPAGDSFDLPGFKPAGEKPPSGSPRPRSSYSDRPRSGGGDRPRFGGGDKPRYGSRDGGDKPRYGAGGDKPRYGGGDKPSYGGGGSREGGRPPYRPTGDRPAYGGGGDRPRFGGGDKPRYGAGGDKPRYGAGDKPSYGGGGSREGGRPPYRPAGDRPAYGGGGDRPRFGGGDKPRYGSRDGGDKPRYGGGGDRPRFGGGDKPRYGAGADRPRFGGSDRPASPYGDRDFKPAPRFEPAISPEVSKFLPLKHEKGRHRESRFLIEGAKNISDVVAISPGIIHTVLVAQGFEDDKLKEALNRLRVHTQEVSVSDLNALCDTETPQGIVAVANLGAVKPDWAKANMVTLLDGIQDPGNVGAILRTSAALGVDAVVFGKGTCDPYNPKVVRASAASLLRVPIETGEDLGAKIQFLRLKGFSVVATSPHAPITLTQAKLRRKVAILFGNEGAGVGINFLDQADALVRIPMQGKVESLNVAVAHGLMTYELMRLREKP